MCFQAFPSTKNGFKVGMKLEGIDPLHPSLYCVLSVAEVKGHRLRLHFDGYSECYDFWTNADSPFIFPVGWVEKNGKELQPPLGMYCHLPSNAVYVPCCFHACRLKIAVVLKLQLWSCSVQICCVFVMDFNNSPFTGALSKTAQVSQYYKNCHLLL